MSVLSVRDTIPSVTENGPEAIKLTEYEDLLLPWKDPATKLREIREFTYKPGDVLICSYPKTGTHWLEKMLSLLLRDEPEASLSIALPILDFYPTRQIELQPSPKTLASHLKYQRLPRQHIEANGKVIVLSRNPKDTAVSMFHFLKKLKIMQSSVTWEYFLDQFVTGRVTYGSFSDYYLHWDDIRKQHSQTNIEFVRYEDLHKDCVGELMRLCDFLELKTTKATVQRVVNRCSFQTLKTDVEKNPPNPVAVDDKGKANVYRKGEVGDWKNYFTVAQNERFDKLIAEKMKDSNFVFECELYNN